MYIIHRPTSADALIFGYLEVIGQYQLPGDHQLQLKLSTLQNLCQFCNRMREQFYPEMKKSEFTYCNCRPEKVAHVSLSVFHCVVVIMLAQPPSQVIYSSTIHLRGMHLDTSVGLLIRSCDYMMSNDA